MELWKEVDRHSPAQRSSDAEIQAARAGEARAARYLEPQIYASGRFFNTNDPALLFMSRLGQREVESKDFTPSKLNEPTPASLAVGTLGITMPLYEGGLGAARTAAAHDAAVATEHNQGFLRVRQYADTFSAYGSILAYRQASERLEPVAQRVNGILGGYEVGRSTNPVGYSGLLALQGVTNRMRILSNEYASQTQVAAATLSMLANLDTNGWRAEILELSEFASRYAPPPPALPPLRKDAGEEGVGSGESYRTRSLRAQAESILQQAQMERSVTLPKVGLFAEGNSLTGDRGTGTSYLAGAYLTWTLSAPTARGAEEEARLHSAALQEQANAAALEDRVTLEESRRNIEATTQTLALLRKSNELLDEQIRTGERLYASGSMSAGQLAELFSKRLDVLQAVLQSELAFLQAHRFVILHSPELPHGI